jgi:uncharacterized repeat protein (TIGR03803 family)
VFELNEKDGVWRGRTIYEFAGGRADGSNPYSGIVSDDDGTIYGTTSYGGAYDDGIVYALSNSSGKWKETVLHNFNGSDGANPVGPLRYDASTGLLYGTTVAFGAGDCGTVFELVKSSAKWTFTTIYAFQRSKQDACNPQAGLQQGAKRRTLFGVTYYGGATGQGAAFELRKDGGSWTENVIYSFSTEGNPVDIIGGRKTGNLFYGVTDGGGQYSLGTIFSLTKQRDGWSESELHSFAGGQDGSYPVGLKRDTATGYLYGTTVAGGSYGDGTLFQLVQAVGSWSESILHSFGETGDGIVPAARPVEDKKTGVLYGTTIYGGSDDGGTVWSYSPGR